MDYKLSDHLEEKEDELGVIARTEPKTAWYKTESYIHALKQNWMGTYEKQKGKFERMHVEDQEKLKAKTLGVAVSDMRIIIYMFKNKQKQPIKFKEIRTNTGMPKRTCEDSLTRMEYRGFIIKDAGGKVKFTKSGLEFVQENLEKLELPEIMGKSTHIRRNTPPAE